MNPPPGTVTMRNPMIGILVCALGLGRPGVAVAQGTTVLRCGSLIDGRSEAPVANAVVVVRDGRVTAAGAGIAAPAGATEIDLRQMTCLP